MSDRVFLVFSARCPSGRGYFRRVRELGNGERGKPTQTVPELDDDITQAINFSPEIAITSRDLFRKQGCNCWIEDSHGNRLFERTDGPHPGSDNRQPQFVMFSNGLGLTVMPAIRSNGPCWTVRSIDIPTFAQDAKHTAVESVFGTTPEEAAAMAMDMWGQNILFPNPSMRHPQQETVEQQNHQAGLRPADRSSHGNFSRI